MKELDDKNGIKDDVVGRIVRAKNQRAIVDCTDANNNTPLSEAASESSVYLHQGRIHGRGEGAIAPPPLDGCWPKNRDARPIKSRFYQSHNAPKLAF